MTGWGGRLFMSGGFNGVTLGRLLTLSLPSDPCILLPTPEACNSSTGSCVWCRGTCASSDTAERYYRKQMIKADVKLHTQLANVHSRRSLSCLYNFVLGWVVLMVSPPALLLLVPQTSVADSRRAASVWPATRKHFLALCR